MGTMFRPGYFAPYYAPRRPVLTKVSTRSATLHLLNSPATPTDVASVSLNWCTRSTEVGAAVDQGTTSTNSSGELILTGLSIAAGAGFVNVWSPSDPMKNHTYPVTFA
jgi:hypothetical protein